MRIRAAVLSWIGLFASTASGQVWSFDAYAGRDNYRAVPAAVASTTGVFGIRFNDDRRIFQAAAGLPLASETVTWGIVGFGDRFSFRSGGFAAGADISLLAHAQRDPVADTGGRGLQADLLPMVSYSSGAGELELKSGPRWYGSRLGDVDWTRRLWTTEVRGGLQATEEVLVESDLRHESGPQDEDYTRLGFSLSAFLGPTIVHGGVGHWVAGLTDMTPEWDASIAVPVRQTVWLFSSIQRESFNPLFLNPTRTSWSAGVSFQFGGRDTRPAGSSNAVRIEQGNRVQIRLPVEKSHGSLSIAGDFTSWKPVPLQRQGNEWHYDISLAAGVYRFAFRTEDGKWIVPESIPNRTDDGMGGTVAVMVVP